MKNKRQHGQYFTKQNPFIFKPFKEWFEVALKENNDTPLLEPFAGINQIPFLINEATNLELNWDCYDIDKDIIKDNITDHKIKVRDVFLRFPKNNNIIVTNPPYLAKNSATRRGLNFPNSQHDDLYKYSLEKCLNNANYVAAIIPESFIVQNLFLNRLTAVISLTNKMFDDTECPVCLALFSPEKEDNDFYIYSNDVFLGKKSDLSRFLVKKNKSYDFKFNDPMGEVSIFAIDNNKEDSIYFDFGEKISSNKIKHTSRAYSRIKLHSKFTREEICNIIILSNQILNDLRNNTHDVFFTAFKGLRKDGKYRRRIDFQQVRNILSFAIFTLYPDK